MQIEELYRAAIVALRNRQWEQATRNLLTVVNAAPQHRDAARVLMQLERLHPVSYWRGAFMFAIERSAWDQAEAAAARLNEIDPALHNANDIATKLQELTALGWYLPQAPEASLPAAPDAAPDVIPPPASNADSEAWLENLARRQEEQSLARPTLDDIITPHTLEIPLDRLVALDQAEDWHTPEPGPIEPEGEWRPPREPLLEMAAWDDGGPASEDAADYVTPRALKAVEFSEAAPDGGLESQRGPFYDTLSTPRALKTATFLDSLARAGTATGAVAAQQPPSGQMEPALETSPAPARAAEPQPAPLSEPVLESPGTPSEAEAPPQDEATSVPDQEQALSYHPPVTATVDSTQPYHAPQMEDTPARSQASGPRQRLIVAAIVALLIVMLALIARLARTPAPNVPASASPAGTPVESGGQAASEIPALIARLDAALAVDPPAPEAATIWESLRAQIEALTLAGSPLREALLTWLDAGQQRQAAALRLTAACAKTAPDPDQCAALQTEYDLLGGRTRLARNVVCILAGCPDV